jgi:WD40 repeat protein
LRSIGTKLVLQIDDAEASMKTYLAMTLCLMSLTGSSLAFAQQRCEMIFSNEDGVVANLAKFYVDIENTGNKMMQETLAKNYHKKFQAAKEAHVNLESLSKWIEAERKNRSQENQAKDDSARKAKAQEDLVIDEPYNYSRTLHAQLKYGLLFSMHGPLILAKDHSSHFIINALDGSYRHWSGGVNTAITSDGRFAYQFKNIKDQNGKNHAGLELYEIQGARLLETLNLGFEAAIEAKTEVSPDGRWVAIGLRYNQDGTLVIWDILNKKIKGTYQIPPLLRGLSFSGDSNKVAVFGSCRPMKVIDINSQREIERDIPGSNINSVFLNYDGSAALISHLDVSTITAYSVKWDITQNHMTNLDTAERVHLSADGRRAITFTVGQRGKLTIYDFDNLRQLQDITSPKMNDAAISADGKEIMIRTGDEIKFWNTGSAEDKK